MSFQFRLCRVSEHCGEIRKNSRSRGSSSKALELDPGHLGATLKYAYILKKQEKYEELIAIVGVLLIVENQIHKTLGPCVCKKTIRNVFGCIKTL